MKNKPIQWGWESQKPTNMRSKEHQAFLIRKYNSGRPVSQHVKTMAELHRALKTNDINPPL